MSRSAPEEAASDQKETHLPESRAEVEVQHSSEASGRQIAQAEVADLGEDGHNEDAAVWPAGYYYQDSSGNTQGPCSLHDLRELHSFYPEAAGMTVWAGDGSGGGYSGQLPQVLHWAAWQQQSSLQPTKSNQSPLFSPSHGPSAPQNQPPRCAYAEAVLAGIAASPSSLVSHAIIAFNTPSHSCMPCV